MFRIVYFKFLLPVHTTAAPIKYSTYFASSRHTIGNTIQLEYNSNTIGYFVITFKACHNMPWNLNTSVAVHKAFVHSCCDVISAEHTRTVLWVRIGWKACWLAYCKIQPDVVGHGIFAMLHVAYYVSGHSMSVFGMLYTGSTRFRTLPWSFCLAGVLWTQCCMGVHPAAWRVSPSTEKGQ